MDKDGFFNKYSSEEFCYGDYYEALMDFEEGRQALYTYVKLITAYLQYGIGSYFTITNEGNIHSYAYLWLLMNDRS